MTHALVIGVSAYDHLPSVGAGPFGLSQLGSTAIGAYRFAVWLRDHYRNPDAPLATIRLLLSPSAAEISAGARRAGPPTGIGCGLPCSTGRATTPATVRA
ncbi:MAG TPA: hypothetical protein VFG35_01480 [Actinoplanes sp.]|nr:hypothetical protein [Actinoplanes sp.]